MALFLIILGRTKRLSGGLSGLIAILISHYSATRINLFNDLMKSFIR